MSDTMSPERAVAPASLRPAGLLPRQLIRDLADRGVIRAETEFRPSQFQPASLDLRLGARAFRVRASFLPGASATCRREAEGAQRRARFARGRGRGAGARLRLRGGAGGSAGAPARPLRLRQSEELDGPARRLHAPDHRPDRDVRRGRQRLRGAALRRGLASHLLGQGPAGHAPQPDPFPPARRAGQPELETRLTDAELLDLHATRRLVEGGSGFQVRDGLLMRIELAGLGREELVGYRAQRHADVIDVDRADGYPASDFWEPIRARGDRRLILDPNEFYILVSKERLHIPPMVAAEMVPIDPAMGEFRVHYAGFFDPGFGYAEGGHPGSRAVLEVRSHEGPVQPGGRTDGLPARLRAHGGAAGRALRGDRHLQLPGPGAEALQAVPRRLRPFALAGTRRRDAKPSRPQRVRADRRGSKSRGPSPDMTVIDPALATPSDKAEPSPAETARSFFRISKGFWTHATARQAWLLTPRSWRWCSSSRRRAAHQPLEQVLLRRAGEQADLVGPGRRPLRARARGRGGGRGGRDRARPDAAAAALAELADHRADRALALRAALLPAHRRVRRRLQPRVPDRGRRPARLRALVDFAIGLLNAVLAAAAFFGVLWAVAGSLRIGPVVIPGYMVFASMIYAGLTSAAMVWIGKPLIQRVEQKNAAEARLRYELTRVRESAENIALIGGDDDERIPPRPDLRPARAALDVRHRQAGAHDLDFQRNSVLAPVVPLLLGSPKYLSGELTLGELMQIATAFMQVQIALSWLIDNAIRLAETLASAQRVVELSDALDHLDATIGRHGDSETVVLGYSTDDAIHIEDLSLTQQNGVVMIEGASTVIARGEKVLVKGESGTGKSTLIRAMAGLWPWGSGRILRPRNSAVAFMPQRPTCRSAPFGRC